MIKAIIFDMDGVLIDAKEWHYESLNKALELFGYQINRYQHLTMYDGLPTKRKLEILTVTDGLPLDLHQFINDLKQKYTMDIVHAKCKPMFIHEYALSRLKHEGFRLGVASNSIKKTVEEMMSKANLYNYLDLLLSNEDVSVPKPSPEIYIKAMKSLNIIPSECLIVEDNEHGVFAAKGSGAHVLVVKNVHEVNYWNIMKTISQIKLC